MKLKIFLLIILGACLHINFARAQEEFDEPASRPVKAALLEGIKTASAKAKSQMPDAQLIYADGLTDTKGFILCDKEIESKNWHYRFYSPSADKIFTVHACAGEVSGVTTYIKDIGEVVSTQPVTGRVLDSDVVVKLLTDKKHLPAKYPKRAQLLVKLSHFDEKALTAGKPYYFVTYVADQKFYVGQDNSIITTKDIEAKLKAMAPKKFVRTVLRDTPRRYRKVVPHAILIDEYGDGLREVYGFVNAVGETVCTNAEKDGMRYYFDGGAYVKSCKNRINESKTWNTALNKNLPFLWNFIDTDELMFVLHEIDNACPKEKADPDYKYNVALRNYTAESSPVEGYEFLWEVKCGKQSHYYPALDAGADNGSLPFRTEKAKVQTAAPKKQQPKTQTAAAKPQQQAARAPSSLQKGSFMSKGFSGSTYGDGGSSSTSYSGPEAADSGSQGQPPPPPQQAGQPQQGGQQQGQQAAKSQGGNSLEGMSTDDREKLKQAQELMKNMPNIPGMTDVKLK